MRIVGHILGVIALSFFVMSIQQKEKKKLLNYQLISNVLYGVQYCFLNIYSAGIMNLISIFRCILFNRYENEKKYLYFSFSILLFTILISALFIVKSPLDIIPILITLLYTISTLQKNMNIVRYVFISCAFLWLFYNFKVCALAAFIGNIIEISSGVISIIRSKKNNI